MSEQLQDNQPTPKKKGNKLLYAIIIALLLTIIAGGAYVYQNFIKNDDKNSEDTTNTGGQVIKDYEFDKDGKPIPVKAPNIGMAIKSAILGDVNGKAEMVIKNSGDIPIEPKVIYQDKTIYQSPLLQPGEAVKAELNFGKLEVGEHEFNVLAMYQGGSGLSLKSKVVVFKPGTEVQVKEK